MPDTQEPSAVKRAFLEKYLHRDRPQTPAIAGDITRHAEAEPAGLPEDVVAIQTGKSKRPFFFLHGDWISGAYWCFPLARDLGPDQPFYALEPYSFDGLPVPPSLETIAAAHIKSLHTVQPQGPYLLGGFCNGGLVVYEMARQLHAEGQKLDLLVLMDPMGLVYPARSRLSRAVISLLGKLIRRSQEKQVNWYILLRHVYNYLRFSHYRRSEEARPWRTDKQIKLGRRREKASFALSKLNSIFPTVEALRQDYPAIYDWAAMRYEPPSLYPGKITFFWDSGEPWRRKGWRKAADTNEIEVHIIPGTQMESRTQYLPVLAENLSACLSKVQAAKLS
jgi:thioesterase domain-containing protein